MKESEAERSSEESVVSAQSEAMSQDLRGIMGTHSGEQRDVGTEQRRIDAAWREYSGYDDRYKQANAERGQAGKIQVLHYPEATIVASIHVDDAGRAVSGHEHDPDAQSLRDQEQAYRDYLKSTPSDQRLVIHEGSKIEIADRDSAIRKRADAGLTMHLAQVTNVEAVSGEPTDEEVADYLEIQGVERDQTALFTTLRALGSTLLSDETAEDVSQAGIDVAQLVHFQLARNHVEGFRNYTDDEKQEISKDPARVQQVLAEMSAQATTYALERFNPILAAHGMPQFFLDETGHLQYAEHNGVNLVNMVAPSGDGYLNRIGKLTSEFRDKTIFSRLAHAVESGKKPFMVYGGSHVVALKPVFDAYFMAQPNTA